MKFKILILFCFFNILPGLQAGASIFDSVIWKYERTTRLVKLYVHKDEKTFLNYYRAETIAEGLDFDMLSDFITNYDLYNKMFARTNYFKVVKRIDDQTLIVNADLNFFPYKNRYYYFECKISRTKTDKGRNMLAIEWKPADLIKYADIIVTKSDEQLITHTYGQWSLTELDDNKILISAVYHNDWETNFPMSFVQPIEKYTIISNVLSFINYSRRHNQ